MTTRDYRSARMKIRLLGLGVTLVFLARPAVANEVDGFTEPCKTVNVAAVETGTIKTIEVQEGDEVKRGQILAHLDDDVHQALLAIAEEGVSAHGQLKSATAEAKMRRHRLEKLRELRAHGNARQEEVERAEADLEIADARVLSANEQLELKRLELNKVRVQLNRRAIRAPVDGVISMLFKDEGEFVAPNDPHILELVCLNPLMANFNVPSYLAGRLKVGQTISVYLEDAAKWVDGEVAVVAPVTDAESGTVRVKIGVPNAQGVFHSGEHCTLQFKTERTKTTRRPTRG